MCFLLIVTIDLPLTHKPNYLNYCSIIDVIKHDLRPHIYTVAKRGKGMTFNILLQVRHLNLHIIINNGSF